MKFKIFKNCTAHNSKIIINNNNNYDKKYNIYDISEKYVIRVTEILI